MADDPRLHNRDPDPEDLNPSADPFDDEDEDEEIPTAVMAVLIVLVVGAVVLYLTLGGGHTHFH